jgi:hypothetical protein
VDVRNALQRQNLELPSGKIEGYRTELSIRTEGRLYTAAQFSDIVLREEGGSIVQLKDVATVNLEPQNQRSILRGKGMIPMMGVAVTPLPGANQRLLFLLGGGLAFMGLVVPLGFILPATLCGMGVARAFDAPLNVKSFTLCGLIAVVFWVVFAHVLDVGLGPGLPWLI